VPSIQALGEPAKRHTSPPHSRQVLYGTHLLWVIELCHNADGFLIVNEFPHTVTSHYHELVRASFKLIIEQTAATTQRLRRF
jgi:hypothetical protein